MGYTIEISFDMTKHAHVRNLQETITGLALDFDCDHYYYIYDMDGTVKVPRNHCIIAVQFNDDKLFVCANFIREMKKIPNVYIECIYEDDILCKLIYASKLYLKNIDKGCVTVYNKFKRERAYSDSESIVLDSLSS